MSLPGEQVKTNEETSENLMVRKRDGRVVNFDGDRIQLAIEKAAFPAGQIVAALLLGTLAHRFSNIQH